VWGGFGPGLKRGGGDELAMRKAGGGGGGGVPSESDSVGGPNRFTVSQSRIMLCRLI